MGRRVGVTKVPLPGAGSHLDVAPWEKAGLGHQAPLRGSRETQQPPAGSVTCQAATHSHARGGLVTGMRTRPRGTWRGRGAGRAQSPLGARTSRNPPAAAGHTREGPCTAEARQRLGPRAGQGWAGPLSARPRPRPQTPRGTQGSRDHPVWAGREIQPQLRDALPAQRRASPASRLKGASRTPREPVSRGPCRGRGSRPAAGRGAGWRFTRLVGPVPRGPSQGAVRGASPPTLRWSARCPGGGGCEPGRVSHCLSRTAQGPGPDPGAVSAPPAAAPAAQPRGRPAPRDGRSTQGRRGPRGAWSFIF